MDASVREKLRSEFQGEELHVITSDDDGIEIVVRPAAPAIMLKFESMKGDIGDPVKRIQANEFLVLGAMVWPDKDKFREEIERRHLTGFWSVAAPEVRTITGARENVRLSKL
jgi:hypothetical protein